MCLWRANELLRLMQHALRRLGNGSVAASAFLGGGWLNPECPERLPRDAELRGASGSAGAATTADSPEASSPRCGQHGVVAGRIFWMLARCWLAVRCATAGLI